MMETRNKVRRAILQGLIGLGGISLAFLIAAVPGKDAGPNATPGTRDQARVSALYRIDGALTAYRARFGKLPAHQPDRRFGGWETSIDGRFLEELVKLGFLPSTLCDPTNSDRFHFRYCVYPAGTWGENPQPFYVLAATELESPMDFRAGRGRYQRGDRVWSEEFAFALGSP